MKSDDELEMDSELLPTSGHRSGAELWNIAKRKYKVLGAIRLNIMHHADTLVIKHGINASASDSQKIGSMFHPSKGFKSYWDLAVSFVLLYSVVVSPFLLAFNYSTPFSCSFVFDLISDFFMVFDMMVNFNTTYYNSEKELTKSRRLIAKNYMTGRFIYDLACSFPYELVRQGSSYLHLTNIVLRLLVSRRFWMVTRVLRLLKPLKVLPKLVKLFSRFAVSHSFTKLIETVVRVLIAIHLFTCFILIAAQIDGLTEECWISRMGLVDESDSVKYLFAFYFILTTMSTVGYGDVTPRTSFEIIISISWMFIAVYFLSFNISSISSLAAEADFKKNVLVQKMSIIETYSKSEGIGKHTQSKMKVEVTDKSNRSTNTADDRQELLSFLPIDIKYEIAMSMHQGVIRDFPFFRDKQKEFIGNIFPMLYQKLLIEDEIVYMQNQPSNEIFFISEGKISLVYSSCNIPFRYLVFGDYFGDYEVTHDAKRVFGSMSKRFTKLLVMNKEAVHKFKQDFPSNWNDYKEHAKHRHEINIRAMSEMMVIKKINSEGSIKSITSKQVKNMIQVQAGILTHKSLDFSLEEIRKREVVDLRKNILLQRNVIFSILHGMKYIRI